MKNKNKNINIILKNKIGSLDVVLPLCLRLNKICGFRFTYLIMDSASYNTIINSNIVLKDIAESIGVIKNLSNQRYSNKNISRLYFICYLLLISARMIFKKDYLLHFGSLHSYPYNKIRKIFIKKRVIFSESKIYSEPLSVGISHFQKKFNHIYNPSNSAINKKDHIYARIVVGYSPEWSSFEHNNAVDIDTIIFNNSRKSNEWVNFFLNNSDKYLEQEFNENSIIHYPDNYFLIVDCRLINADKPKTNSFRMLVRKLAPYSNDTTVFVKLHVYSDIDYLKSVIVEEAGDFSKNFIISKLHAVTFYKGAIASFFVNNSAISYEMKEIGIPVIKCLFGYNNKISEPKAELNKCDDYVFFGKDENKMFENLIEGILEHTVNRNIYPEPPPFINCSLFY